jgi:hypothetical protein
VDVYLSGRILPSMCKILSSILNTWKKLIHQNQWFTALGIGRDLKDNSIQLRFHKWSENDLNSLTFLSWNSILNLNRFCNSSAYPHDTSF